ncbi:uncharacterized protein LOC131282752 [Anopheles ziemanni]|uniref:uncharacterized protein LOC131262040 n=1 Tax=Anopheles coustani TaxID=139045 RepID=UPI002658BE2B|nr:uncharacterized protein LOC131262040 [Anopheles coustani]XP_058168272.1 uncharacterized protein LOC131282752 [Anopheles ziemanni]
MREPIATAPATGATMFGISNAQLVQHSFNGGLPPLKADSPMPAPAGILRPVSRASSVGGGVAGGTLGSMKSSSGASSPAASVKRNSSSSSFGSSSDRRSVFYTDPIPDSDQSSRTTEATGGKYDAMTNDDSCSASDAGHNVVAMANNDGDAIQHQQQQRKHAKQQQQRQGLRDESLRRLVDGQVRRKQRPGSAILEGVIGPKAHLKLVSQELEWERKFRDDQLSRILKALIAFETRLKNEQTRIKQQLYEKDDVINRQNCTINRMKRKLAADEAAGTGSDDGEETPGAIDEVAQYCPKCRKNYYRLECRTNGTQTFQYCREDGAESVNTENLSLNSVEYASSSEEQESSLYVRANSFKDARRSRKYTSKRSYQGYQQRGTASRASSFKSNASGPTTGRTLAKLTERNEGRDAIRLQRGGTAADDGTESGHEAYVNIEPNANVPKIVIYENYESDKENKRLDQNQRHRECNNYDNVEPYSNRIDTLHGIAGRGGSSGRFGKQHADGRNDYHLASPSKRGSVDGSDQMELDDGTIFYEANTSVSNNQAKYTEGMEMKQTIETNDDWYASASDMEDSDTALGKPYSNAAVNPVLECVNQILLQQSMDGFGDSNKDTPTNGDGNAVEEEDELYIKAQEPAPPQQQPPPAKEPSTAVRSKRVHFSTQNSMVQVPRITLQATPGPTLGSTGSGNRKDDKLSPTYEIQSIYSNEYEPIGSEQNSYSNYYVDMESKLGSEDREREMALAEKRKTPPALPPKPANLLKLQQLSKTNQQQRGGGGVLIGGGSALKGTTRHATSSAQSDIVESEPDYCSISEIQDSVKCVQIVAEIHKDACEDDYSIVDEEETEPVVEKRQQNGTEAASDEKLVETGGKKSSTELEESFADVPKLPNVAEIVVPPKKDSLNKFISQDNYITKSSSSGSSTSSGKVMLASGVMPSGGSVQTTPNKKDGEFREQLSEIIAEINKQSPAIRTASKKQIPVKDLGSPFRGVSQIPGVAFQSKLKPVDKLSFLSKASSGSIPSLNHHHHTPKLTTITTTTSSAIGRPAIKPTLLKSSLSTKALSSTNLSLGNNLNQFGSPVKSVSYIPNLKSLNATGPLSGSVRENGGSSSVGCSPVKSSPPVKKGPERVTGTPAVGGGTPASSTPVIIAEDSKLPIQAEFDWYNLDAEYGKSNQPDVIVEADPCTPGSEPPTGAGTLIEGDTTSQVNGTQGSVKGAHNKSGETPNGAHSKATERTVGSASENGSECHEEELENVEYNLDEEYKSIGPIVPPPDIIQKGGGSIHQVPPPLTPPKNGKIPYNSLSFKELMQLNETPKIGPEKGKAKTAGPTAGGGGTGGTENGGPTTGNYEHFLDDSGLCSKPIILPRKKRVYYSGPFV